MHHIRHMLDDTGGVETNHIHSEGSTDKLEEMEWSVVRQEDASETEGKCVQHSGQTSSVYGADTWATTRGQ